jgi:sugar lactone lactonase YvrE
VVPSVTVDGPGGYTKVLSATTTLAALAAGNYTVSAAAVTSTNPIVGTYNTATVTGSPATVAVGATATATATYATRPGSGALWVANESDGGTVSSYTAAQLASSTSASATTTISPSGDNAGIAFDGAGNLWVTQLNGNAVQEYTASQLASSGNPTPAVTLTATAGSVDFAGALAFDASGNLWVANEDDTSIVEFAANQLTSSGSPTPVVILTGGGVLGPPSGLAFDASGNLWVSVFPSTVVKFTASQLVASGAPTPVVTLSANGTSLVGPRAIAFDAAGNMWVPNVDGQTISEFTASQIVTSGSPVPAVVLTPTAAHSLADPIGVAFDASGDLWVGNGEGSSVVEFTPSQLATSGSPTPAVTISGSGVGGPWGIAFDPHAGNLPVKP